MTPTAKKCRVTSPFGWRTLRGVKQHHNGIDIGCDGNRELRAIWDAIKVEIWRGWNYGRGNVVLLYYTAMLRVLYQHVNDIYVTTTSKVKQGDVIAQMGWSGDCVPQGVGGMHLHIEVQVLQGGKWVAVNPSSYIEVPNVAATHPANDNLDKSVDPTPSPAPIPAEGSIAVGDVVPFTGNRHYVSADGGKNYAASAGEATVTAIKKGAAYPYHLIYIKGGTSTVYGWVSAANIVSRPDIPEPAPATMTAFKVGDRLLFSTGYVRSTDGPDKALHVAKKQITVNRGVVGNVLTNGAPNPLLLVSAKDGKTPICWCNDGDIRGKW